MVLSRIRMENIILYPKHGEVNICITSEWTTKSGFSQTYVLITFKWKMFLFFAHGWSEVLFDSSRNGRSIFCLWRFAIALRRKKIVWLVEFVFGWMRSYLNNKLITASIQICREKKRILRPDQSFLIQINYEICKVN